ncbi:MAG: hypothetical protein ACYC0V_02905 [Armatimonadota bacterium]
MSMYILPREIEALTMSMPFNSVFIFFSLMVMALMMLSSNLSYSESLKIDDFRTVDAWALSPDGGSILVSPGRIKGPDGAPTLGLKFPGGSFYWGNAARSVVLPPNASGVELDVYVVSASPQAFLTMWLFEADGDGHHIESIPGGKRLSELKKGWNHGFVPITSFLYDPRGDKKRALLSSNKMLIGFGGGPAEVCIANLAFRTSPDADIAGLPRTKDLVIADGPKGRIAIHRDAYPKRPGNANPDLLGDVLRKYGYGVTFLKSGDLADASILNAANFRCLILPYGPDYPYAATDSIRAFLKGGGSFLSTGGYAFDHPCGGESLSSIFDSITAKDVSDVSFETKSMNTRHGASGDTLGIQPDQIGVFDPGYHLKYVTKMKPAPGQYVIPALKDTKSSIEGYSACSMLGNNHPVEPRKWGRHIPLVQAFDSFGRYRGDIGSMAVNYAGPYAGSRWAFFGATNRDLFAAKGPMLAHLLAIVDALVTRTYLHTLESDLACYRDGETVKLSCRLIGPGEIDAGSKVVFRISDRRGREVFASDPIRPFEGTQTAGVEFASSKFASDLYTVTAELSIDGKIVDTMQTGFIAWNPDVIAGGFKLSLKNNYFRDGDRPLLLSGTNVTGAMCYSDAENPLIWDRDLATMRESGVNIMRFLGIQLHHYNEAGVPADPNMDRLPLMIERQLDGIIQLCQKNKVVLLFDLLDWTSVDLTDAQLFNFGKLIAERYRDVPGFMIDLRNEPYYPLQRTIRPDESPYMMKVWNDYLALRYKTDQSLRDSWRLSPPEAGVGAVPYRFGKDSWDDLRTYDADTSRVLWARRWMTQACAGLRAGNPDILITTGFLQEYLAPNKLLLMDTLDFANSHSYNSLDVFRSDIKLFDRRFEGKSVSLGEFGSLPDHDKRIRGEDNPDQDCMWYLQRGHYLFGEGGSFLANWCWKDMDDVVFPWGINYTCQGPRKNILKSFRNQSLMFRQTKPIYKSPEVFLVIPTAQRLGGGSWEGPWGIASKLYQYVESMFGKHVDFGSIDDQHLSKLPASAKVLVYPVPFAIPDDAYERLKAFVKDGGTLCITGDLSYDDLHRRTHTNRLEELCGVRFISENYPGIEWNGKTGACINVEPTTAKKVGNAYVNRLGRGTVYFTPDPDAAAFTPVLDSAYAALTPMTDVAPTANHVFRINEVGGGCTYVMANPTSAVQRTTVKRQGKAPVEIQLAESGVGSVRYDGAGNLISVESQGPVKIGSSVAIEIKGHFSVSSCDGNDLTVSRELMVLPFGEGTLSLKGIGCDEDMIVQTGDIVDGGWHAFSDWSGAIIKVPDSTAYDIRIVATEDRLDRLGTFVASEMMLK